MAGKKSDRNLFNLNHHVFEVGRIGHLQCLTMIPVLAGDSIQLNIQNLMRLGTLRRALSVNAVADYAIYYIPHRHIYGSTFTQMIQDGMNSVASLPTLTANGVTGWYHSGNTIQNLQGPVAKFVFSCYNRIWNRFYRYQKLTPEVPDDYVGNGYPVGHSAANSPVMGGSFEEAYGFPCARMKTPWSTGNVTGIVAADRDAPVTGGGTTLNIINLEQTQRSYRSKLDRDWKALRYTDILNEVWDSGVNIDADERPEMVLRQKAEISGFDVNGTDDAALGTYSGKAMAGHNINMRRKFIPEHGSLWVMCLVRFPTISSREMHPIIQSLQDYATITGDPTIAAGEPPFAQNLDSWFAFPAGATPIGTLPYGQHFRYQQNNVHFQYETIQGYPFLEGTELGSQVKAAYIGEQDYADVFQSNALGQWHNQAAIKCDVMRHFPNSSASVYAGAR